MNAQFETPSTITKLEVERFSKPGLEVIIKNPAYSRYGSIGITAGIADTIGATRIRVMIGEGEIFLCDPTDLEEN